MDNKHVKLSVIGFAILLIGLVSISYAFFNYTRTGEANTVRTGRIYFNATQGQALNITNAFPLTSTEAGNANLDTVTLGILGDTTYADGEEFEITLVDVNNTISNKEVPINYIATYTANNGGSIGASSDTYWTARNSKNANIYTLSSSGEVSEGKQVLVGYIKSGATGINGTLSISAYIDADRIAISDTYNGPESTPNANNGTTSEWVNGRTVFTTTEWNSINSNPISFKIKAESNEGIWVDEPVMPLTMEDMCPGCVFMITENMLYTSWNTANQTPVVLNNQNDYYTDYQTLINNTGKQWFLGLKLNDSTHEVDKAYACGVKGENPNNGVVFCLEGAPDDSKYNSNISILTHPSLWGVDNPACDSWLKSESDSNLSFECSGNVTGVIYGDNQAWVGDENMDGNCSIDSYGLFGCYYP